MENDRLYEAIFIFDKYCVPLNNKENVNLYSLDSSLPENVFYATLRLLAANNLLTYKDKSFYATEENLLTIKQLKIKKGYPKKMSYLYYVEGGAMSVSATYTRRN